MTIDKGTAWGEPVDRSTPVEDAADDSAVAAAIHRSLDQPGQPPATLRPQSGDLLRTIGLERPRGPAEHHRYPVDIGLAHLARRGADTVVLAFVAHLTVRNRRLTGMGPGLSVAVMNAAWLGELRLAPRAHPNDGLVDVVDGTVGLAQRREANRRAATGSHLPHPRLRVARTAQWQRSWPRPVAVWLDGVRVGRFDAVEVEVLADAGAIVA